MEQFYSQNNQDLDLAQDLAQVYQLAGEGQKAHDLAAEIVAADPSRQKNLQNILGQSVK